MGWTKVGENMIHKLWEGWLNWWSDWGPPIVFWGGTVLVSALTSYLATRFLLD